MSATLILPLVLLLVIGAVVLVAFLLWRSQSSSSTPGAHRAQSPGSPAAAAAPPVGSDSAGSGSTGSESAPLDPAPRKDEVPMDTAETSEVLEDVEIEADAEVAWVEEGGALTSGPQTEEVDAEQFPVVRVSDLHEVVNGGFGIGSAAPISDGAQPLGHPIKANLDTKTYQDLHSPWYAQTRPDVWFLDVGFAERAGFHRAE